MLSFKYFLFSSLQSSLLLRYTYKRDTLLASSASSLTLLFLFVSWKKLQSVRCVPWFDRVKSFRIAEAVGCHLPVTPLCSGTHRVTVQPLRSAAQLLIPWCSFFLHLCRQSQYKDLQINKNVVVKKGIVLAKYHIPCCGELSYLARMGAYSAHVLLVVAWTMLHHSTQLSIGGESSQDPAVLSSELGLAMLTRKFVLK